MRAFALPAHAPRPPLLPRIRTWIRHRIRPTLGAPGLVLGLLALLALGCGGQGSVQPHSAITPNWTVPAPPNATVGQSYTASVAATAGATYLWSVTAGSATLLNATTATVTFTPTAGGSLTLQCVVTGTDGQAKTETYQVTAASGATLNAEPATISSGQGTLLLATFTGTGVVMPGSLSITSGVGLTVKPAASTTYTLTVDGQAVAAATVQVKQFVPKFVYVSSFASAISAFTLDTSTGGLTAVAGPPTSGITPDQVVASPSGRLLYAAGNANGIYGFTIDGSTGALTPAMGSPFAAGGNVLSIAVDPYERFLYTSGTDGKVYAYTIDSATGVLTPVSGSPYAAGSNSHGGVLVHPSGKYLYAVASTDAKVYGFAIDQTTGALTPVTGSPFDAGGGGRVVKPYGVAVDPTGAYLFTKGEEAAVDTNYMAGFSVDIASGALNLLATSPMGPFPGQDAYHGLSFHPTLNVLYTAFYSSSTADAGAFSLDLSSGVLTGMTGSPYNLFAQHGSDNIAVDRSGRFAYSVCWSGNRIARMRVDSTGLLTKLDGTPLGVQDVDTTAVPAGPVCTTIAGTLEDIP